jgi:putative CocE/NonD family hydrolase
MRDGTHLLADIYQLEGEDQLPVLLQRTPYSKTHAESNVYAHPAWYAEQGYLVVVQDVRGRGASEGTFDPFISEATDGYDSVEWAAALPRSNGKVAMYGFSYVGATQLLAASLRPPSLVCICPGHTSRDPYEGWTYKGGALNWAFIAYWSLYLSVDTAVRAKEFDRAQELLARLPQMPSKFGQLPVAALDAIEADLSPYFFEWLEHATDGPYWESRSSRQGWETPTFAIAGWYDIFCEAAFTTYKLLKQSGVAQKLVVGPWLHMPWSQFPGSADFGPHAKNNIDQLQLAWLDYWCKSDNPSAVPADNNQIDFFVMGSNEWRQSYSWPPPDVTQTAFYFACESKANSLNGDGTLVSSPAKETTIERYLYDPIDPAPSLGGRSCCFAHISPMGVADQRPAEIRNDVLVFTGPQLRDPITIAGPVHVVLHASTTGEDGDWTAKLVDVHPDGHATNVCDGIVRARYATGTDAPRFLAPESINEFDIDLGNVAHCFREGHHIRVDISSSCFPAYDRNPSRRLEPAVARWEDFAMATQSVYHGAAYPSRVLLPVVPSSPIATER